MSHAKLYVIGNGFDLHHKMQTRYSDFKKFVEQEDHEILRFIENYVPERDGVAENDWANLESALGEIDCDSIIDDCAGFLQSYGADDWSDSGHHDFQYEVERIAEGLSFKLRELFARWIRTIQIPQLDDLPNKLSTLDKNGLYLNFNYTSTLTSIYLIPTENILYIHGEANMKDTELVLGHARDPAEIESLNDPNRIEEQDSRETEGYAIIDDYFDKTFKQSEKIIQENNLFFSKLSEIEEIIVLGHSLSEVDWSYLEALVDATNHATRWTVACRNEDELLDKSAAVAKLNIPNDLIKTVAWSSL
jgi:hypothetical protein